MGETRRLTKIKTLLRKTATTAISIAAVCGIVAGLRELARVLAGGIVGETTATASAEVASPGGEKVWKLSKMIPEELRLNAGGIAMKLDTRKMDMPFEQAEAISANEAEALGWERYDLPLTMEFALETAGGSLWIRPDKTLVRRTHSALASGGTLREDLILPLGDLATLQRDLTLDEIVTLRGDLIGMKLPGAIRAVMPGRVMYTQYTERGNGASLLIIALSTFASDEVKREAAGNLRRYGWKRGEDNSPVWTKDNLSATIEVQNRGDGQGVFILARFSDDENDFNGKDKKDEEL